MTTNNNKMISAKTLLLFIYCCILLFGSMYGYKKMRYNWDILAYMAVILYYDHVDLQKAHEKVYTVAKEEIPEEYYKSLTDTTHEYRKNVASFPAFHQQMSFYVLKPLYTGFCYLFYKAGISLTKATIWPCIICYFLIGVFIFFWIQKYSSPGFAFAGGLAIMFSGPVFTVAFLSSPDALSALLVLLGIFYLVEKKSWPLMAIFLLLSVFARIDNVIPVIFIFTAARFTKNQDLKFNTPIFLGLCAVTIITYFLIAKNAKPFGSDALFYSTVSKQLNPTININTVFNFKDYLTLAKWQFMTGIFLSSVTVFVFLILLLVWGTPVFNLNRLTIEQSLPIIFFIAMGTRFILEPHIVERIYVPYYISILIFLVKKYWFAVNELNFQKR